MTVMVCLAVCFVKQHSALDVLFAMPLGLIAEIVTYGKDYWLPRLRRGDDQGGPLLLQLRQAPA